MTNIYFYISASLFVFLTLFCVLMAYRNQLVFNIRTKRIDSFNFNSIDTFNLDSWMVFTYDEMLWSLTKWHYSDFYSE